MWAKVMTRGKLTWGELTWGELTGQCNPMSERISCYGRSTKSNIEAINQVPPARSEQVGKRQVHIQNSGTATYLRNGILNVDNVSAD